MNVTTCCSAWQRFSTGIPCSCGYINHWWITVLATVPSEGLKITGVQFRLATLPSMRKIIWWYHALKGEKCTNLFLSFLINIVCRYFNDFPLICWQNGALPILVPQRHINTAFIPNWNPLSMPLTFLHFCLLFVRNISIFFLCLTQTLNLSGASFLNNVTFVFIFHPWPFH